MELILGSQSPRRRELLERMGLSFTVLTAEIDETKYATGDPETTVRRICEAKARAVARKMQNDGSESCSGAQCAPRDALILASDTIVVLDGRIMGKPHDAAEARAMLAALSGREHQVYTAFTLLPVEMQNAKCKMQNAAECDGAEPYTHCEMTYVKFRELTPEEIAAYVATEEPMDKAGAYGIQNLGSMLVESLRGDYFTVMGLPVCRLAQALKRFGLDPLLGQEKKP
jgi:septum formation protein